MHPRKSITGSRGLDSGGLRGHYGPRRTIMGEVRPPQRDQAEWQRLCKIGGPLLKLQVCIAAKGAEGNDWFMGRLFVAEAGILIESTDDMEYTTPLLRWEDITDLHDGHPTKSKKHEVLVMTSNLKMRIQLGSPFSVEWLQETYTASTAEDERWFSFGTAGSDDEVEMSEKVVVQKTWHPGQPSFDFTDDKLPDLIPMLAPMLQKKPFADMILPQTSIKEVAAVLQKEEWPFVELLSERMKCKDISMTPWKVAPRFRGTQIRCAQYTMPIPKNPAIPDAIIRLVGVPEYATCLSHYRLLVEDDKVIVLMQSGSKGVKHGDNLCIQAFMCWRQEEEDVVFTEQLDLIWEHRLVFYARAAKPFIEGQARTDAFTLAKSLGEIIKSDITKMRNAVSAGTGSSAGAP